MAFWTSTCSKADAQACLRSATSTLAYLCTKEPVIVGTSLIGQPCGCDSGGHAAHGRPPDDASGCNGQAQRRTVVFGTFSCSEGTPAVSTVSPGVATGDTAAASMSVVAPVPETSAAGMQEQDSLVAMPQVEGKVTTETSSIEEPTPKTGSDDAVCRAPVCSKAVAQAYPHRATPTFPTRAPRSH